MKNNKGFSLVELIVVIAIMAILAAIAIPTFAIFINKANVASDVQFANDAEYAAELANAINGTEIKEVKVTVGADKKATNVVVVFEGENEGADDDVSVTVAKDGTVTPNVNKANDWAKEIKEALDWEYTFKSVKKAGTWQIDQTDGSATKGEWVFTSAQ